MSATSTMPWNPDDEPPVSEGAEIVRLREPGGVASDAFDPDETARQYGEELPPDVHRGAPEFTSAQGIHRYSAGAPTYVSFEFDQLRSDRDGGLSGEVAVRYTAPGLERLIHLARVTLTGTRSRQELANHLAKRLPGPQMDWPELVEQASVRAIQAHRAGEPAILLREAPEPIDAGYLIKPLLVARQPTIWFGDGGTGKSLLALAAALTVHGDRADVLGVPPASQLRVAYLDWEYDPWEHRQRMRGLLRGGPEPDLVYLRCYGSLREQVDRLRRVIREREIGYLVVDSVAAACGGEPESAEIALGFFNALRALEVGALCIAHTTKSIEAHDRPFGSAFWHNMARSTWLFRREQELGGTGLKVGLYHKKANSGPLSVPLGFEVRFDDGIRVTRTDVRESPELAQGTSVRYRMEYALRGGPLSYEELAEEIGSDVPAVKKAAQRGSLPGGPFVLVGDQRKRQVALRASSEVGA